MQTVYFRFPWYSLLGYGLRCHRAIKEIAVLLGITDMRCKVRGPTTPLSLVRAAFQGLLSQVNTSWPLLSVFLITCASDIWSLLVTEVQGGASWRLYWNKHLIICNRGHFRYSHFRKRTKSWQTVRALMWWSLERSVEWGQWLLRPPQLKAKERFLKRERKENMT